MLKLTRMRNSRDSWKDKNKLKRKEINRLKRKVSALEAVVQKKTDEIVRLKASSDDDKKREAELNEIREMIKKLEEESRIQQEELSILQENAKELANENERQRKEMERIEKGSRSVKAGAGPFCDQGPLAVKVLCVYLATYCGISFRAVPKILKVLTTFKALDNPWVPHFTSCINWVLQLGMYRLSLVQAIAEPWIAIMDTSIDIGTCKAIVILRVRLKALQERGSAITLADCEVIYIKIVQSSTGEVIQACLEEAFGKTGRPDAILSDQGGDLQKGVRLYRETHHCKSEMAVINDLGHVIANALKAEFKDTVGYRRFMTIVYGGASRLRQTKAAAFMPPNLSKKGRFQGISKSLRWASKTINTMAVPGQVPADSVLALLRKAFPKLTRLRPFIEHFEMTTRITNKVQELLKNKGLNRQTYIEAEVILQQLPESSQTREAAEEWLKRHLQLHCRLGIGQTPLLVSSDAIESLLGKLKATLGRAPVGELNRMTLILPVFCGKVTVEEIFTALSETAYSELVEMQKKVIPITLLQQRRQINKAAQADEAAPKVSPLKLAA